MATKQTKGANKENVGLIGNMDIKKMLSTKIKQIAVNKEERIQEVLKQGRIELQAMERACEKISVPKIKHSLAGKEPNDLTKNALTMAVILCTNSQDTAWDHVKKKVLTDPKLQNSIKSCELAKIQDNSIKLAKIWHKKLGMESLDDQFQGQLLQDLSHENEDVAALYQLCVGIMKCHEVTKDEKTVRKRLDKSRKEVHKQKDSMKKAIIKNMQQKKNPSPKKAPETKKVEKTEPVVNKVEEPAPVVNKVEEPAPAEAEAGTTQDDGSTDWLAIGLVVGAIGAAALIAYKYYKK